MNERTQELYAKACLYARDKHFEDKDVPAFIQCMAEKFAELIIEETHRKVIASILITDVVMDANGQVPTSEDYIRAINNDFGIKK